MNGHAQSGSVPSLSRKQHCPFRLAQARTSAPVRSGVRHRQSHSQDHTRLQRIGLCPLARPRSAEGRRPRRSHVRRTPLGMDSHPRSDAQRAAPSVQVASSRPAWGRKDATVEWPRGFAKALRGKPEARRNPSRQLTTPREEQTRDDTLRRPEAPLACLSSVSPHLSMRQGRTFRLAVVTVRLPRLGSLPRNATKSDGM